MNAATELIGGPLDGLQLAGIPDNPSGKIAVRMGVPRDDGVSEVGCGEDEKEALYVGKGGGRFLFDRIMDAAESATVVAARLVRGSGTDRLDRGALKNIPRTGIMLKPTARYFRRNMTAKAQKEGLAKIKPIRREVLKSFDRFVDEILGGDCPDPSEVYRTERSDHLLLEWFGGKAEILLRVETSERGFAVVVMAQADADKDDPEYVWGLVVNWNARHPITKEQVAKVAVQIKLASD